MGRQCTGKACIKPTEWKNSLQEGPLNIVPCCRGSPCHSCKVDMADGMRYTGSKLSRSGVTNVLSLKGLLYRNEGGLQVAIPPSLKSFNKTIRDRLFQKKYTPPPPPQRMANWKFSWEGRLIAREIQVGWGDLNRKIIPPGSLLTLTLIDTF